MWAVAAVLLALTMSVDTEPCTMTVSFKLGNGAVSSKDVFRSTDFGPTSIEEFGRLSDDAPVMIHLPTISDENMLGQFKRFLCSDVAKDEDLSKDLFSRFARASDSLCLCGDMFKRFTRNRRGRAY
jgi:hypothetical protein